MKANRSVSKSGNILYLRRALLNWYPFRKTDRILLTGDNIDDLYDMLGGQCLQVTRYSMFDQAQQVISDEKFDYVIAVDIMEHAPSETPERLRRSAELLSPGGVLLLGFRNRFGLRYLCGGLDRDLGVPFSGIADCGENIHLYAKQEMNELLKNAGFSDIRYYYPMPDADFTQAVYTDEYLPEGSIRDRVFPYDPYHSPFILSEADLYDDVIREKMLPFTANYYLAECRVSAPERPLSHVIYAALSTDRGPDHGFATVLYSDGTAWKRPLSEAGIKTLQIVYENSERLRQRGILTVDQTMTESGIMMPIVKETPLLLLLERFLHTDPESFLNIFSQLLNDVLKSSEPGYLTEEEACKEWSLSRDALGPILKKAYIDMIPYNAFWTDGQIRYYDQEFTVPNCPALYVLFRALRYTWIHIKEAEKLFPLEKVKKYFGLTELWNAFQKREDRFVAENRNYESLGQLYEWADIDRKKIGERRLRLAVPDAGAEKESALIRDVHTVQLRLLKALDRVCRENGLRYWAIHGTLLGAVRHHGFIPWDDDIDVAMPRKDYDRLLALGEAKFIHPFFLQTPLNNYGCYYGGYSKLRYDGTGAIEPQNEGKKCHQGIWIDIFPLDNFPDGEKDRSRLAGKLRFFQRVIFTKAYGRAPEVLKDLSPLRRLFYLLPAFTARRRDLVRMFDKLCRDTEPSGCLAILACYYGSRKNKNIWPAEWFSSDVEIPFADMCLHVPCGWKDILASRYGTDFMTLPPEEKRYRHRHVNFYPNLESIDDGE